MLNKLINSKTEIGMALILIGVPIGMYINYFMGNTTFFSNVIMLISLILIFNFKKFLSLNFNNLGKFFYYIIVFHIFCIFYLIYSEVFDFLLMHLCVIFLIFSLFTVDLNRINIQRIILYTFWLSAVCSLLGLYFLSKGMVVGRDAWELRQNNENYALEIFTISYAAIVNFSCVFYYFLKKKYLLFSFIMLFVDLFVVVSGGKRSPFVVMFFIFILWFMLSDKEDKIKILSILSLFCIIISFILLNNNFLYTYLFNIIDNTLLGIQVFLGNVEVQDQTGSARFRVEFREWAYNLITNHFDIHNYIFGYGYMTKWIDNPVLHSYIDMGIYGFFSYVFIVIYYPISIYIKYGKTKEVLLFFTFCIYSIVTCLNSGNPYLYSKYFPVILLGLICMHYRKLLK